MTEKKKIEIENLKEEASSVFDACTKCGLCKRLCPVFKVILEEHVSPKGHAIMLSEKILRKAVFKCSLCKACEESCPLNLKICDAILAARNALVLGGNGEKDDEKRAEEILKGIGIPDI